VFLNHHLNQTKRIRIWEIKPKNKKVQWKKVSLRLKGQPKKVTSKRRRKREQLKIIRAKRKKSRPRLYGLNRQEKVRRKTHQGLVVVV
jgi:hypothetical protein